MVHLGREALNILRMMSILKAFYLIRISGLDFKLKIGLLFRKINKKDNDQLT